MAKTLSIYLVMLIVLPLFFRVASAGSVNDLYTVTVRVADRTEPVKAQAVATALGIVLTKLSGQRDSSFKLASQQGNSAKSVQSLRYLSNGVLEVVFDRVAINSLLVQSGMPIWDRLRPVVLVVSPAANKFKPEMRVLLEFIAKDRGLPIVWTTTDTSDQFPEADLGKTQALAARYQADAVLLARIPTLTSASSEGISTFRWQLVMEGASQETKGTVEEGLNFAADQLGRYYAASSKQTANQILKVSGIKSVEDYATVVKRLGELIILNQLSVQALSSDELQLQLRTYGSSISLRRLLSLDNVFVEESMSDSEADGVFRYRYSPVDVVSNSPINLTQ